MKKTAKIVFSAFLAFAMAFGTGCSDENNSPEDGLTSDGCERLFSFESYDNIHNTIKEMGNRLGRITVSDQHVTDGEKSMKLEVHGNYSISAKPYFKIFCSESEFLNGDFSWFKSLKMDIYNDNAQDLHVKLNLNVYTLLDDSLSVNTEKEGFTLKANSMNTIEYEIPAIESLCNISNINYICIEFDECKTEKDDDMNVFYIDNLRGVLQSEQRIPGQGDGVSIEEGLGFENFVDSLFINPFDGMELSRKTYADAGVPKADGEVFGDWLLYGTNPSKGNWPSIIINFSESYEPGTTLTFWLYVDISSFGSEADKAFIVEAYANTGKEGGPNTVTCERADAGSPDGSGWDYNTWFKVTVTFNTRSPQLWLFVNMSDVQTGAQLVSGDYAFCMDNFLLTPATAAEEEE